MINKGMHNGKMRLINVDVITFFFSASGVAGLAGAIASNPIDVVKVG